MITKISYFILFNIFYFTTLFIIMWLDTIVIQANKNSFFLIKLLGKFLFFLSCILLFIYLQM